MVDAPAPIGPVLGEFAALIALAAVAGLLRRSRTRGAQWTGGLLFSVVIVLSVSSSLYIRQWGLADATTCTPFEERAKWGILIGLNLAVLAAWLAARRGNVPITLAV